MLADAGELAGDFLAARAELRDELQAFSVDERANLVDAAGNGVADALAGVLEALAYRLALLVEMRRNGVERIEHLLTQARDAFAESAGHLIEIAAQRRIDLPRQAGERERERLCACAQSLVDLDRFGVEAADDLAAARAHDLGDLGRVLSKRFAHRAPARLETGVDAVEELADA